MAEAVQEENDEKTEKNGLLLHYIKQAYTNKI